MAALIDTNILVYRYDFRFPEKQKLVNKLLRDGIDADSVRLAHQTIIKFVAATTRSIDKSGLTLLTLHEALREAEEFLAQFTVLYPDERLLRLAVRGTATYGLSWFDAHMWAYAEHFGLDTLWSEDFTHQRLYGRVRAQNPFLP